MQATGDAKMTLRINIPPNRLPGADVFGTLRLARELCPSVTVNTMLSAPRQETGRTKEDLDEDSYIRILKYDRELRGIHISPCPDEDLPAPGGPECGKVCRGLRCGGGRSGFSVNWQGVMSPCNDMEMIRAFPLETGFDEAWRQINQAANDWPRASACEGCAYSEVCERCAARVAYFAEPGTWPHALCERTKRFVQQGVYPKPDCEQ
jgi:radical SAM protein with 4Fe4S-binding SPASM domain